MPKIPIPLTDDDLDTGDGPVSIVLQVVLLVVGFVILLITGVFAQRIYNAIANETPDQMPPVEVL